MGFSVERLLSRKAPEAYCRDGVAIPRHIVDFGREVLPEYQSSRTQHPIGPQVRSPQFEDSRSYSLDRYALARQGYAGFRSQVDELGFEVPWNDVYEVRRAVTAYLAPDRWSAVGSTLARRRPDPIATFVESVTDGEFNLDDGVKSLVRSLGLASVPSDETSFELGPLGHLITTVRYDPWLAPPRQQVLSRYGLPDTAYFLPSPLSVGAGFALQIEDGRRVLSHQGHPAPSSSKPHELRYYLFRSLDALPSSEILRAGLETTLARAIHDRHPNEDVMQHLRLRAVHRPDGSGMREPTGYCGRLYRAYHQFKVEEGLVTAESLRHASIPGADLAEGVFFAPGDTAGASIRVFGVSYETGATPRSVLQAALRDPHRDLRLERLDVIRQTSPTPPTSAALFFTGIVRG